MQVWPELRNLQSDRAGDSRVEVGVVEDDERRVAAELERDLLQLRRALPHQELADLGRAGEPELAHERVRRHLAADRGRVLGGARHDGEHARAAGPPRSASAATASADSGVCSAGFSTIVQPAASAGAVFRVGIAAGKFQGVIPAVTPIGCLSTRMRRSALGAGIVSPYDALRLLAEPLVERGGVLDLGARLGERLALLGHEQAREIVLDGRASGRRGGAGCSRGSSRCATATAGNARPAASIARRVSAAPMRGTSAITSPEAGLVTGNVWPESESTHLPSR